MVSEEESFDLAGLSDSEIASLALGPRQSSGRAVLDRALANLGALRAALTGLAEEDRLAATASLEATVDQANALDPQASTAAAGAAGAGAGGLTVAALHFVLRRSARQMAPVSASLATRALMSETGEHDLR